jgi:D-glycero-D-manno-heptose 1,7-bisphosphate phosphatase
LETQEPIILIKRAVFLDRDGTVNRDLPGYIKSWSEFEFLPGSIEAVRDLTLNGFHVIIITNQSAVPRNLLSLEELEYIHAMMRQALELEGGRITDVFYCPHMPDDNCACRKPKPGLIYRAQEKYRIDLASAVMVGDSARDIECARNAGCGCSVLLKTGNYKTAERRLAEKGIIPDFVAEDLYDASRWIIKNEK